MARYEKREIGRWNQELAYVERDPLADRYRITWKKSAKELALEGAAGQGCFIDSKGYESLPASVDARSWEHLCSLMGLHGALVRLLYRHHESGQPSAARKAQPAAMTGPVVYCQGDWLD